MVRPVSIDTDHRPSDRAKLQRSVDLLHTIGPLIDRLSDDVGRLSLELPSPVDLKFSTADGFSHTVTLDNVIVAFAYCGTTRRAAGEFPIFENPSREPFTEVLPRMIKRLADLLGCFGRSVSFRLQRFGLMNTMAAKRGDLPPGLLSLLEHLEKPWGRPLIKTNCYLLAPLAEDEGFKEQCHHYLSYDSSTEEHPDEVQIRLDWQRRFLPHFDLAAENPRKQLDQWAGRAVEYFDKLGEEGLGND